MHRFTVLGFYVPIHMVYLACMSWKNTQKLLLLTKRLTWRLVQKLQGHVTYQKNEKTTCSVDREKQAVEQRSEPSVRHCEQVRL